MEPIAQQKQELIRLIESLDNPEILTEIKHLLNNSERELHVKERIVYGALRSEEDFKAGRTYTREQITEKTNKLFDK